MQDYGGPVGFRIMTRNPKALEWLIIQNTNAYEVGFSAAWGGLRNALWLDRSEENEKGAAGLLELDTVKATYLGGSTNPALISPDTWNLDYFHTLQRPHGRQPPARSVLRLPEQCDAVSQMAGVSQATAAENDHLLGGREISSSRPRAAKPTCSNCPKPRCTGWLPATLPRKTV